MTGSAGAQEFPTSNALTPNNVIVAPVIALPTAEETAPAPAPAAADAVAGPVMEATTIAARADMQVANSEEAAAAMFQTRDRRGTTLMLVGGAAFLAGLLIGDDAGTAVALGGAVVGLYGLYLFLQ